MPVPPIRINSEAGGWRQFALGVSKGGWSATTLAIGESPCDKEARRFRRATRRLISRWICETFVVIGSKLGGRQRRDRAASPARHHRGIVCRCGR
jgi:hypothetical protein